MRAPTDHRARSLVCLAAFAAWLLGAGACAGGSGGRRSRDPAVFGDAGDEPGRRAATLTAMLTLQEKVAQLQSAAPAIPRLGIPAYDWWSEALHGVARNGRATVFPQSIGLAATFDQDLVGRVGRAIADEARAKFDAARARGRHGDGEGDTGRYQGLTFFAPNVNIFRDPRWGRGQETYGEDPFLTSRLAVAYVRGLQGDDPRVLRVAAVAKHFAAHSGPESLRHRFDARVDAHDLTDTYLPQFEALVREARVAGIMAAYNRINGEPCVASPTLLGGLLRGQWGFDGFVVGDCGAVQDLTSGHHVFLDETDAAAAALRAGTDLDCGTGYRYLTDAVRAGLVTEREIDRAVARLLAVRFRLGLLDPTRTSSGDVARGLAPGAAAATDAPSHVALAREAAQKSLVLLRNDGALPIGPGVRRIAIVGPLADDVGVLLGNYHGDPGAPVTVLAGIRAAAAARGIAIHHAPGVGLAGRSASGLVQAVATARDADVIIAVLGLSPVLEGEEGDPDGANPAGDRQDLALPGAQPALLQALLRTGRPTVVVLTGGGAIALPDHGRPPDAVLMAWYPGEQGGNAVADVLFGDISPSGRLPITFYRSVKDLPSFVDYGMAGRTYRYFEGEPLFPFGHGLGYAEVTTRGVVANARTASPGNASGGPVVVRATVENRGSRAVEEVVQLYAAPRERVPGDPLRSLVAFQRVALPPGREQSIVFDLSPRTFTRVDRDGARRPLGGAWDLTIGNLTANLELPSDFGAGTNEVDVPVPEGPRVSGYSPSSRQ